MFSFRSISVWRFFKPRIMKYDLVSQKLWSSNVISNIHKYIVNKAKKWEPFIWSLNPFLLIFSNFWLDFSKKIWNWGHYNCPLSQVCTGVILSLFQAIPIQITGIVVTPLCFTTIHSQHTLEFKTLGATHMLNYVHT